MRPHPPEREQAVSLPRQSIPVVSIIIPALQEEKEIENLLSQITHEVKSRYRCEVIVSDGGSKDRTVEIADRHKARIVHAPPGTTQTIASGRNLGARAAKGSILMFFNADVRLNDPATFFDVMAKAIESNGVVAATCNVKVHPEEETAGDKIFHGGFNLYCRFLNAVGLGMGRGECHVIRREAFDAVGGYNEAIAAGEDFELFLRLRKKGAIAFVSRLTVTESPRRYRAFGYVRIALLWFLNAVAVFISGRSLSKAWIPVR